MTLRLVIRGILGCLLAALLHAVRVHRARQRCSITLLLYAVGVQLGCCKGAVGA